MNPLEMLWWTAKGVGWDNLPRRLLQAYRTRTGILRRHLDPENFSEQAFHAESQVAQGDQPHLWTERSKRFLPPITGKLLTKVADRNTWEKRVTTIVERAFGGEYLFFFHWYGKLGWVPDFNLDPVHDINWPTGQHWGDTSRSGPPYHDIKLVWEPSRFSLAYYFARQYVRSGDERFAQGFWEMFDAWVDQNPPELSVAWGCGQEMTFRLMGMLFAAINTLQSEAATPRRLEELSCLAWRTGKQIDININKARAQGNNHAISEAVGLWTVGTMFGEFEHARRWCERAKRILSAEVKKQIYDDGSYVQHSMNYHRVMMDDLLWICALCQRNDETLPPVIEDRLERATSWILEMIDPVSGRAPNYGANDGALVLPLSCCDYPDFRPAVQAAHYLLHRRRCFDPGPWDEKMLWLFGAESLDAPVSKPSRKRSFTAPDAGYYILRGRGAWAMTRCHTYRDRPSQADMLHLDLWYKGENVLRDGGSYMYYCESPWDSYFSSTKAHNTVEIDSVSQMTKGPRFLWFKWTRSRLLRFESSSDGRVGYFAGEHYGYKRGRDGVTHRRTICRIDDTYLVIDDIIGSGEHEVVLRWRLYPTEWEENAPGTWTGSVAEERLSIRIYTPEQMHAEIATGRESPSPEGWESLYYGEKQPVPVLLARGRMNVPLRLLTVIGPKDEAARLTDVKQFDPTSDTPLILTNPNDPALAQTIRQISDGTIRCE